MHRLGTAGLDGIPPAQTYLGLKLVNRRKMVLIGINDFLVHIDHFNGHMCNHLFTV